MAILKIMVIAVAAVVAAAVAVAGGAMIASLMRGPLTPPISMHIPDLAFLVPGVSSFVVWEAKRDARRAVREDQGLLLGYLHRQNVGELEGCVAESYDAAAGPGQDLPKYLGYSADGVMTVVCDGHPAKETLSLPVVECGNPYDYYQVVYGQAFNNETLRLIRSTGIDTGRLTR
jgi:hypothetical protein